MNLMGCRLINLNAVYQGFLKTGQLLISWDGSRLCPPITGDDIGIYLLIPQLAHFLNIELSQAIHIFFGALLMVPLIIGVLMICATQQLWIQKAVGTCGLLLLARFAYAVGDVYLAYYTAAVILPLTALFIIKNNNQIIFFSLSLFSGAVSALLHYVRAYSFVGPCLVAFVLITYASIFSRTIKMKSILIYLVSFCLVAYGFEKVYQNSIEYGRGNLGFVFAVDKAHVFWHQVYLGLGFLNIKNAYGISYDDAVGGQKVAACDPQIVFCSKEYEETLKNEFFEILFTDPIFVLMTLFAKLGVLLFFFLKFANIGLLTAYLFPKEWWIDIAFFIGMAFNSIYVLIAVPLHEYALGFISLAVVWGIVSINYALEHVQFSSLPQIKKFKKSSPSKMQEA